MTRSKKRKSPESYNSFKGLAPMKYLGVLLNPAVPYSKVHESPSTKYRPFLKSYFFTELFYACTEQKPLITSSLFVLLFFFFNL